MASMSTQFKTSPPSGWLLLTDFASKYRISVSTLRRRIKAGQQPHRFEGGRYYLPDQFDAQDFSAHEFEPSDAPEPSAKEFEIVTPPKPTAASVLAASMKANDEPLITTTSKLLNELKQAYTLILHEKEEQIIYLKEEIADLKTLVRVLESDNARLSENARLSAERDRRRREPIDHENGPSGNA